MLSAFPAAAGVEGVEPVSGAADVDGVAGAVPGVEETAAGVAVEAAEFGGAELLVVLVVAEAADKPAGAEAGAVELVDDPSPCGAGLDGGTEEPTVLGCADAPGSAVVADDVEAAG